MMDVDASGPRPPGRSRKDGKCAASPAAPVNPRTHSWAAGVFGSLAAAVGANRGPRRRSWAEQAPSRSRR